MEVRIEDVNQNCQDILQKCDLPEYMSLRNMNVFATILKQLYINNLDFQVETTNKLTVIYIYKQINYE